MRFPMLILALLATTPTRADPIAANEITVVDGDTIDARGARYRMIGYDTPEIKTRRRAVSEEERVLARKASARLNELLKSGPVDLTEVRCSCTPSRIKAGKCNQRRKCAVLSVNGENVGKRLIEEQLAVEFVCKATSCPRLPDWPRIIKERQ